MTVAHIVTHYAMTSILSNVKTADFLESRGEEMTITDSSPFTKGKEVFEIETVENSLWKTFNID